MCAAYNPAGPYWYRFLSGDAASRVGRASTLPAPGAGLERLRFGFVSCSNYEHGYFSAYRHLADENPDVVLFLGDYIYEYIEERRPIVRRHSDGIEAATLPTYRNRYAQYRLDPDLQRLHAEAPALMTWDDHEVQNDYADKWSQYFDDPELFLLRRAAAYQAFYEHMPLRPILSRPEGPRMRVYDRFTLRRPYRNLHDRRPAVPFARALLCAARQGRHASRNQCRLSGAPARPVATMLGFAQETWLHSNLAHSKAQWNLIAQDVLMAQYRVKQGGADAFSTDNWDGYPANRTRLLKRIQQTQVSNPVVVGGDIHSFFANDLKLDFDRPGFPGRRHRIRRYLDLVPWAAVRGDRAGAAGQSARALLREPPARLCLRRSRARADAGAHARRLRRRRPEGGHFNAEDVCRRGRTARRGGGLKHDPGNVETGSPTRSCSSNGKPERNRFNLKTIALRRARPTRRRVSPPARP